MRGLVPRPPLVRDGFCSCPCHDLVEANEAARDHRAGERAQRIRINGLGAVSVRTDLVTEAAAACGCCRNYHCPALSGRPEELDGPLRRWNPPPMNPAAPPTPTPVFGGGDGDE